LKKIVTLTVNPTVDKSSAVHRVNSNKKLRCSKPKFEPGGGGVNVSRALKNLGFQSKAYLLAGGSHGAFLKSLLDREDINYEALPIEDETRENLMVFEASSGNQYRFGMPGPEVQEHEWRKCLDVVFDGDGVPDYIVASGSLCPGMPEDFYKQLADLSINYKSKLIVDTSGKPLEIAFHSGVYLIKPNIGELAKISECDISNEHQMLEAAQQLIAKGKTEIVVVSMGAGGALLVTGDHHEVIRTPMVPIESRIGAGDSMVAGVVMKLAKGSSVQDAVKYGVASGAAACMTPGSQLCRKEDTDRIYKDILKDGQKVSS